jgi:hypothetical protein
VQRQKGWMVPGSPCRKRSLTPTMVPSRSAQIGQVRLSSTLSQILRSLGGATSRRYFERPVLKASELSVAAVRLTLPAVALLAALAACALGSPSACLSQRLA